LRPDEPVPSETDPPDAPPDRPPPENLTAALAELKLLKLMQEEVNRRTAELAARRAGQGAWDSDLERELAALAQEQGRLADMLLNLIQKTNPPPEDGPPLE
jgi:hypothetical protein